LFLATLALILWQLPWINMAYHQAGLRAFLQTAFQKGDLPPTLPWSGRVEADPLPALARLEQANKSFIPLQMSLNPDRSLGMVALMTGDLTGAQQRLLSRLEAAPEDYMARFFLGETYRRLGDYSTAIEHWALAGAQEPLMELARNLIEQEEETTALMALEAVMALDKTDTEPRWWAADILSKQGATEEALALYQEITLINPRSEAAHMRVAESFLQQGNLEQALLVYQKMIDLAPQQATGYSLMGRTLFGAGQYEQAIGFFEQALQRNPKEPGALLEMLGESYTALGRWADAIEVYNQAVEIDPNRPRVYMLMGEAQCKAGTPNEARFYFEQAVALGNRQEQLPITIQYIVQHGVCPP
jgi:tetratricopeptide (TPR) repeat protein